jgi:hypothetical protein
LHLLLGNCTFISVHLRGWKPFVRIIGVLSDSSGKQG